MSFLCVFPISSLFFSQVFFLGVETGASFVHLLDLMETGIQVYTFFENVQKYAKNKPYEQ
jgi:hypothetical protein